MRQRKWVRAVAVVIGTTSVGVLAVETPAAAGAASPVSRPAAAVRPMSARPDPGDGGGCTRRCWAHWVVYRGSPPLEFYRHVKRHPRATARFDFSTDGCSGPGWLDNVPLAGGIVREHKRKFRRACLIHDFGYRNFGPGEIGLQWWRMTDKQQSWGLHGAKANIDRRFLQLMYRACKSTGEGGPFDACPRVAKAFYGAVVQFGGSSWSSG